ncbi:MULTISPECIES: hypothetical protein [Burkholderia]|uniref:Uncharacterized protein n=1 Tax=Burkholderia savannae TaxID=1637837 RepID=A0ABR5TFH7_9BURK|nr:MULTISPECIES: hypothetical protein [Burkholderia]AOJ73567.1 hypothetical protein WS78_32575 [Burkholderia savannae]KVG50049.1 hypothetical protein WS77_24275 [Burkholderia sp. MSMB0265]KVG86442.1 hypothetical protein WS81_29090 [Burkholderia sp. MSMB2040]KVG91957.1 hypothetical protein WS83_12500 [Burkholderia sp. MSMB2042]KVG93883.1 hypothetical protein WS82_08245 [Burkholderia sp. MSMB2041]
MNIQSIAEGLTYTVITLAGIALAVWLCVELPWWSVPVIFGIVAFLGIALLGPIVVTGSYLIAAAIKAAVWLVGRLNRRTA